MKFILIIAIVAFIGYKLTIDNISSSKKICQLNNTNIITIGDSLANGYGVAENESFAFQVPKNLNKNPYKLGINGETTSELLARFDSTIAGIKDIGAIIISSGGNDFLKKQDKQNTKINLEKIINKAKAYTDCVIMLGVPSGLLGGLSGNVDSMYYELAKKQNIILDDKSMPKILISPNLKIDQIHPNSSGHQIITKNIITLISKITGENK